ncbi:hypothetical protein YIM_05960 [Amycolatopsis sp. YIM 10]|nr:hypothetical protein YIM_05960 [Amycolatopsis sp. YIM 10]
MQIFAAHVHHADDLITSAPACPTHLVGWLG